MELTPEQRKQLIDEYGALERQLAPWKPAQRRLEDLGKVIRAMAADHDPEQSLTLLGGSFQITLGPAQLHTCITDLAQAYKVLGKKQFLKIATLTIKAFESAADPASFARLTEKRRVGPRPLIVSARDIVMLLDHDATGPK